MEKSQLAQARKKKHWTLKQAANTVGVSINTFNRWELGEQRPYRHNLDQLCKIFNASLEELGFGSEAIDAAPLPPHPFIVDLLGRDLVMRLQAVAFVPQCFEVVQQQVTMILEEFDTMNGDAITRRDALIRLASLPFIASLRPGASVQQPEDVITQCAAGIAACWQLSKSSHEEDLHRAFKAASAYIPPLKSIVETASQSRKDAAALVGQCSLLKTVLGWHLVGLKQAISSAQDAITYAQVAGDMTLQVSAMDYLSWAYYYDQRSKLAAQTAAQAQASVRLHKAELPPILSSGVYSTYAVMQARNGEPGCVRMFEWAEKYFLMSSQRAPSHYIYMGYTLSEMFVNYGVMQYFSGEYSKALDAFHKLIEPQQLATKVPLSGRARVETLNFMALSSLKQKDKDMEQTVRFWTAAMQGAITLQSERRYTEALLTYDIMDAVWPDEKKIKELRELTTHWSSSV